MMLVAPKQACYLPSRYALFPVDVQSCADSPHLRLYKR